MIFFSPYFDHFIELFEYVVVFYFGLCLGSFATFLAHRIFSEKLSIFGVRSVCPKCNNILPKRSLIPLFSYIFLKGRCFFCQESIPLRYPATELGTAFFTLISFWQYGTSIKTALLIMIVLCSFIQIATDLEYYMASDFTDLIMCLAVVALADIDGKSWQLQLLLSFGGMAFMMLCRQIVMWRIGKDPLGLGDVKIVGAMAPLALNEVNLIFVAGLFGIIGIIFAFFWKKITKSDMFPFAPAIMLAFLINYFFLANYFTGISL